MFIGKDRAFFEAVKQGKDSAVWLPMLSDASRDAREQALIYLITSGRDSSVWRPLLASDISQAGKDKALVTLVNKNINAPIANYDLFAKNGVTAQAKKEASLLLSKVGNVHTYAQVQSLPVVAASATPAQTETASKRGLLKIFGL